MKSKRVLIIDDNRDSAETLATLLRLRLEALGVDVAVASLQDTAVFDYAFTKPLKVERLIDVLTDEECGSRIEL